MATAKKAASSKVTKKAAPKKSVAKAKPSRSVSKRSTSKKVIKKARVKKSAVKKTAAKRSTIKKTAVKKSAIKKRTAKKAVVKKASSRVQSSGSYSSSPSNRNVVVLPKQGRGTNIGTPIANRALAPTESKYESIQRPQNSGRVYVVMLVLIAVAAYFVLGANKSNEVAAPETTPSPTLSMDQSPTPTAEPSEPEATITRVTVSSMFTSTGTDISWRSSLKASSYELKIQASESKEARLVSFAGNEKSYSIDKDDTVGFTTFVITATFSDGSMISSKPLKLSGQY